jgi:hypothetical protein
MDMPIGFGHWRWLYTPQTSVCINRHQISKELNEKQGEKNCYENGITNFRNSRKKFDAGTVDSN